MIFQNILGIKNFRNLTNFFSGSPKYYFLERSGTFLTFNETFVTLSSLTCNIFSKNSWFLFLEKSQVQKTVDVITCFFCTVKKNKDSEASRLIVGTSPVTPPFPVLYFSKCLVCVLFIYIISISIICVS